MAQDARERRRAGSYTEVRPGVWAVRASSGRRADGKRRTLRSTVRGTERDAEVEAVRLVAELGRAESLGDSLTLAQYYRGVFRKQPSSRGTPRSAATLRQYDGYMERDVLPRIGGRPLNALTHGEIKATVQASPCPANCKRVLRIVLRAAYNDELMADRPMERRIVTPSRRRPQRDPWDAAEAAAALDLMRGRPLEAYLILGLSGLRLEEALAISPAAVVPQVTFDLATGTEVRTLTAMVERTYTDADDLMEKAKTEFSARPVPVIVAGRSRLLEIIAATRPDPGDPAAVDAWRRSRLVPLRGDTLYKRWRAELEALGLRFIPPDMLRHTSETMMQAANLPDTLVSRLHGHTQLETDYRHYLRPGVAQMEQAAREVHRIMPGGES